MCVCVYVCADVCAHTFLCVCVCVCVCVCELHLSNAPISVSISSPIRGHLELWKQQLRGLIGFRDAMSSVGQPPISPVERSERVGPYFIMLHTHLIKQREREREGHTHTHTHTFR